MAERVLVTGGAGFIGSHVVDLLIQHGKDVIVLDNLEPQVHGPAAARPEHLRKEAELVIGDVRDRDVVRRALDGVDVVIHLAAAVGLAQSMYQIDRFVDVNGRGTAVLLESILERKDRIKKLVVASSMSLYGEGRSACDEHGPFDPHLRPVAQLATKDFAVRCPRCGEASHPTATPESARLDAWTTVYAVSKRDQEELVLSVGAAYDLPAVALRLFNVYGPRQSLSNPYTGVAAIFSSRLLNGAAPIVFEDGLQTRDFTHVRDVAEAFVRVLSADAARGVAINVGAGRAVTLLELGELLGRELGVPFVPEITHNFRKGDIRHCTADNTLLHELVGFRPQIDLRDGVRDLVSWVRGQTPSDHVARALGELKTHGLLK
ncbi:MAG: SDR family NAD(P)-dependent oxidoreductase [Polyangiales bacterium]